MSEKHDREGVSHALWLLGIHTNLSPTSIAAIESAVENPEKYVLVAIEKRCGNCEDVYSFHDGISLTWGCRVHNEYGGRKKRGPCKDWSSPLDLEGEKGGR